jgi:transcriptional regulator with XRE-family HTH domain
MSNFFEEWVNESEEHQRLVAEESLILDVTEKIHEQMEALGVSRAQLAERMGKSKAYVSQLLSGSRNMTLRSLADISFALGLENPKVVFSELDCATEDTDEWRSSDNVIHLHDYRTNFAWRQPVNENDWAAAQ